MQDFNKKKSILTNWFNCMLIYKNIIFFQWTEIKNKNSKFKLYINLFNN